MSQPASLDSQFLPGDLVTYDYAFESTVAFYLVISRNSSGSYKCLILTRQGTCVLSDNVSLCSVGSSMTFRRVPK